MDKEVLLDFKQARSHKKVAYGLSPCANGKNKSLSGGNLKIKIFMKNLLDMEKYDIF